VLGRVEWFGDAVIWLTPQPDQPFRDLTAAIWRRFPGSPPYAGAHPRVVPHLTIGHDAALPVLRDAAAVVSTHLPIRVAVEAVQLIAGTPGHRPWPTVCTFPLGAASPAGPDPPTPPCR
jgi:hypothetical protein